MKEIERLKELLSAAEAVVIGAGAGLSSAAGFNYGGENFLLNFKYMHDKYGYTDMYSAGFHDFISSEEKWGYWSKFIYLNRYKDGAKQLYKDLYSAVKDKNYFVITTNVDHQFQLAGFDKTRLFYTQGDYGLFQCGKACHKKTYDNKDAVLKMVNEQKDGKIPSELIPICPICGEEMDTNLRKDNYFVEDEGWHRAAKRYSDFIESNKNGKILFLELGVGFNTPVIIKYPFMQMTKEFKNAFYVCVNNQVYIPPEISEKSLSLQCDLSDVISAIKQN